MRTSTKRILSITVAAVFLIATLVVYLNFIRPEVEEISELRALVASKGNLLENQEQAVTDVQDLITQFKNIATLQETAGLAMPGNPETIGALRQIEAIARTSGATLTSLGFKVIAPRSSAAESFIKKLGIVEVNMSAEGNYEALKQFLQFLETSVRVANIKEFTFRPAGPQGGTDKLVVSGEMYYQE